LEVAVYELGHDGDGKNFFGPVCIFVAVNIILGNKVGDGRASVSYGLPFVGDGPVGPLAELINGVWQVSVDKVLDELVSNSCVPRHSSSVSKIPCVSSMSKEAKSFKNKNGAVG